MADFLNPKSLIAWIRDNPDQRVLRGDYIDVPSRNITVKKVDIDHDIFWCSELAEVNMMRYLWAKLGDATPHLEKPLKFAKVDDKTAFSITAYCNKHGSLTEFCKTKKPPSEILDVLVFQLFYTLAVIAKYEPKFVHNNLTPDSVYVKDDVFGGYSRYTFNNRNFYVPNVGFSIVLGNFGGATIPGVIDNERAIMNPDGPSVNNDLPTLLWTLQYDFVCKRGSFSEILEGGFPQFGRKRSRSLEPVYNSNNVHHDVEPTYCEPGVAGRCAWVIKRLGCDTPAYRHYRSLQFVPKKANDKIECKFAYATQEDRLEGDEFVPLLQEYEDFIYSVDFPEDVGSHMLFDWAFYVVALAKKRGEYDFGKLRAAMQQLLPTARIDKDYFETVVKHAFLQWSFIGEKK